MVIFSMRMLVIKLICQVNTEFITMAIMTDLTFNLDAGGGNAIGNQYLQRAVKDDSKYAD
jgi:hypothetical protein